MELRADNAITIEQRVDHGALLAARRRSDGTLLVEGYAAREGVQVYRQGGRTIRELVPAETLADSAGGLARTVLTLEHPVEGGQVVKVTPENVARYGVGDTDGLVTVEEGGFIRVQMAVRRADAVDAVESRGLRELSPLYDAGIARTPGVHPAYGPYDQVQVSRTYNSLALTQRGRGGREVRFRADAAVADTFIERRDDAAHHEVPAMHQRWLPILLSLGLTQRYDTDDAAAQAVESELKKRDATAAQALAVEKTRADSEKARADRLDGEVVSLKAAEQTRADAADRAELEEQAKVLGVDPKAHADNKALRVALASKHLRTEVKADSSDDYLRGILAGIPKAQGGAPTGRELSRDAWAAARARRADSAGSGNPDAQPKRRMSANERQIANIEAARKAQGKA